MSKRNGSKSPVREETGHALKATTYARDVVAGRVPACRWVRLACKRHVRDVDRWLKSGRRTRWQWDVETVNRIGTFLELLPHVKGKWAREEELIILEPWQCFTYLVPFGWRHRNGKRRYRRAYVEVPRKNAKSTITAGLGLFMLTADGEEGAEVYSGAGTEKQAWEVFGPARLMAQRRPELREHFGVSVNARNLNVLSRNARFEPIIGQPGDGASPSFSITDEYHEHPTSDQLDTMVTGMGSREQPMAWVITTAGTDTSSPCYALRTEVTEMLNGTVKDDSLFGVIYTLDDGDDWTTREALQKANPNFGVSVFEDYLLDQQQKAINHPRHQSTIKTKHFNVWTGAASPYFNSERWIQLADPKLKPSQFHGMPMWGGMDLASKLDLTCCAQLFKRSIKGEDHYYVFLRHYVPETVARSSEARRYKAWLQEGHIIATPGAYTDYDRIQDDWMEDAEVFRIVCLPYDPWNATQLAGHLLDEGLPVVELPQTTKNLSEPMKELGALIEAGRIHHNGDPVLTWALGNVTAQEDRNGNVYPRKEKASSKIDPAVALIHAVWGVLAQEDAPASVYAERGFLSVG